MTENIRAKILAEALREIDQHGVSEPYTNIFRQNRKS